MKILRASIFPLIVLILSVFSATTASAATSYGFDDSDPRSPIGDPISLDGGAITLTSDDMIEISGDINNGDNGNWSILANSDPNLLKIWDNINIALETPSSGFDIYCTTGSTGGPTVTLTITTYLDGVVVDGPITQELGALNSWEQVTTGTSSTIDEIEIVGRETGADNTQPFGCDDLTLNELAVTTTTVATGNSLANTGSRGTNMVPMALVLVAAGLSVTFVLRRRSV